MGGEYVDCLFGQLGLTMLAPPQQAGHCIIDIYCIDTVSNHL